MQLAYQRSQNKRLKQQTWQLHAANKTSGSIFVVAAAAVVVSGSYFLRRISKYRIMLLIFHCLVCPLQQQAATTATSCNNT